MIPPPAAAPTTPNWQMKVGSARDQRGHRRGEAMASGGGVSPTSQGGRSGPSCLASPSARACSCCSASSKNITDAGLMELGIGRTAGAGAARDHIRPAPSHREAPVARVPVRIRALRGRVRPDFWARPPFGLRAHVFRTKQSARRDGASSPARKRWRLLAIAERCRNMPMIR